MSHHNERMHHERECFHKIFFFLFHLLYIHDITISMSLYSICYLFHQIRSLNTRCQKMMMWKKR